MERRRVWREEALQALYAIAVGKREPSEAVDEIVGENAGSGHRTFVRELVLGTLANAEAADALIAPRLQAWTIERLPPVDRCILRMATYELSFRPDVPPAVAINEAVELAKRFSTEDSGRFVNGVLSAVARSNAEP
jgi:transcription antitermination protein NusB